MATIKTLMGKPWEPGSDIRALLAATAMPRSELAALTSDREEFERQLAPLLAHQQPLVSLTASLAAARTAMKPLLDTLDQSSLVQIAAHMPAQSDFSSVTDGWRRQSEQMNAGLELIRSQAPADLSFPLETFDQAEGLLRELSLNPVTNNLDLIYDELTPETEAQVLEAVESIEPSLKDMNPAQARALVVAFVSVLVFLVSVHLSLTHPDLAERLALGTGGDSLVYASGAGWLAGKIWDQLNSKSDDPDQ